jgi:hypothetical protein
VRLVSPVVPFSGPKLGAGLAFKDVAGLHEGFAKAKLVIAYTLSEVCICR